jgi:hypothetical protein
MNDSEPSSVTETPWFWVMLFSLAALAAIATIGPKFERREQIIETKFHARERGLQREAAEPAEAGAEGPQWNTMFTLGPIAGVVGVLAMVSLFMSLRYHQKCIAAAARSVAEEPSEDSGE